MRTTLLRLTLLGALLSLTGCVFAVGDTRDWEHGDDDECRTCRQCREIEHELEVLEDRLEILEAMHDVEEAEAD